MTEPADSEREDLEALPLPPVVLPWRIDDHESRALARFRGRQAAERLWDALTRSLQRAQASMTPSDQETVIATAARAPIGNVRALWPMVCGALHEQGIDLPLVRAGAAATIAAETYSFSSESERGPLAYFDRYEGRTSLGNLQAGDGFRFRGRGPLSLTGRKNYLLYGQRMGIDLVGDPDRALEPVIAAQILALYFRHEHVAAACEREDWLEVRKRVNGGYGNWNKFARVLRALLPTTVITPPPSAA